MLRKSVLSRFVVATALVSSLAAFSVAASEHSGAHAMDEGKMNHDGHMMHDGHMQKGGMGSMTMSKGDYPELNILLPKDGATVSSQLAVVFATPGHMADLTMGAPTPGTHLHIDTKNVSLMPTMQQLISLGGGHYLFLFDLPVKPGDHQINVYWSDGNHKTITDSVRSVTVTVPEKH